MSMSTAVATPSAFSPAHRRFLVLEQCLGAAVVNFGLNYLIAWGMFRGMARVPMWGQQSVAGDIVGTAFLLPLITTLVVTPLARHRVRSGALAALERTTHALLGRVPRATLPRGVVFGVVCTAVVAPLALVAFRMVGFDDVTLARFLWFKATFAAVLGALVTPPIALYAISEP